MCLCIVAQVQSYATGDVVSSFTVKSASRFTSMALTKPGTHLLLMDDDISRLQMFSVQGVFVRDMLLRPSPNPALRPRSFAKMKRHLNRSGSVHVIDADHVVVGFPDGPVCVHDLHSGEFIQVSACLAIACARVRCVSL